MTTRTRRAGGARPPRPLRPAGIGLIKVGRLGKEYTTSRGNPARQPVKLDFFLLCHPYRVKEGNFAIDHDVMRLYAPEWEDWQPQAPTNDLPPVPGPKRLAIVLFSHEPTENAYYEWAYYDGRRRQCYNNATPGAGVASWLVEGGEETDRPCPCEFREKGECKDHSVLRCALVLAPGVGGAWMFHTTAKASADALFSSMDEIRAVTGGYLAGLPLELAVYWRTVERDGKRFNVPLVNVKYPSNLEDLLTAARDIERNRLAMTEEIKALAPPAPEAPDLPPVAEALAAEDEQEQEAFAAEFYPSSEAQAVAEEDPDTPPPSERVTPWYESMSEEDMAQAVKIAESCGIPAARVPLEMKRFGSLTDFWDWLDTEVGAEEHQLGGESGEPVIDDGARSHESPTGSPPAGTGDEDATPAQEPEVSQDEYLRLEAMHMSLLAVKVEFPALAEREDMTRAQYDSVLAAMQSAWQNLPTPKRKLAWGKFCKRCEALGLRPRMRGQAEEVER